MTQQIQSSTHRISSWSKRYTVFEVRATGEKVRSRISQTSTATLRDLDTSKVLVRGYTYEAYKSASATKQATGRTLEEAIQALASVLGVTVVPLDLQAYTEKASVKHDTGTPGLGLFVTVLFHPTANLL